MLEGKLSLDPEYKNAYLDYSTNPVTGSPVRRRRRTTSHPATNLKIEGKMDTRPEYSTTFVDFPRQRPQYKRPQGHLRSEGDVSQLPNLLG